MSTAAVERRVLTRGAFIKLNLFVCGVATGISAILGSFASVLYFFYVLAQAVHLRDNGLGAQLNGIGAWVGASAGLIAGLWWCRAARAVLRRGTRSPKTAGVLLGAAAAIGATLVLHLVLMNASGRGALLDLLICLLFFGLPAGLIHGFVSSLVLLHWSQPVASELSLSPAVTAPAGMRGRDGA